MDSARHQPAGKFAKLSLPSEGWENSPLRLRFLHAGYRGDAPTMVYFGAKTILAVLLPVITYLYITLGGAKFGTSGMLLMLYLRPLGTTCRTSCWRGLNLFVSEKF